ncbi:unnamed protein product [Durusdinium trenchii]|uniref:Arf-GAP domain-containing protein n=1 Tax=Durusdinium trenchii TaxID=1381693 RepID=A0ABP0Q2D2_9DINO
MAETDKATARELQRIRRLPKNRVCPNCLKEESLGFGAVCTTFKTFICHDCKSAHQSFSHRCKSVQMSVWTMEEVKSLDESNGGGNAAAERHFLSRLTEKERVKQAGSDAMRCHEAQSWTGWINIFLHGTRPSDRLLQLAQMVLVRPQGSSPDAYKRFIERAYIKLRWAEAEVTEGDTQAALPKLESAPAESMEQSDEKPRKSRKSRRQREGKLRSPDGPDGKSVPLQEADHWQLQQHSQLEPESASYASYGWLSYEPVENYWGWDQHAGPCASYPSMMAPSAHWKEDPPGSPRKEQEEPRGPPSVSTASPPFSAASWSTAWSTPTAKAASLPLDPTNPWAEDVLQLCEKHGQNVAGRFDLSPVMAGRSSQLVRNCGAVPK